MVPATLVRQPWYKTCSFQPGTFVNPDPIGHVRHFHNEAAKREYRKLEVSIRASFEAGDITREQVLEKVTRAHEYFTYRVPVYRGVSTAVYRAMKNDHRRRKRKQGFAGAARTIKRSLPFMKKD